MPVPVKDGDWTWDDLQVLPDGQRYEVVDGSLVVNALPTALHEYVVAELHALLRAAAPEDLVVLGATGVEMGRTYRGPDVQVVRREAVRRRPKTLAPGDVLLVVEVLSPSSVTTDRVAKRHEYAEAGIPSYWLVDPDVPSITVLHGADTGRQAAGAERFEADVPFPVVVVPEKLLP